MQEQPGAPDKQAKPCRRCLKSKNMTDSVSPLQNPSHCLPSSLLVIIGIPEFDPCSSSKSILGAPTLYKTFYQVLFKK